MTGALANAYTSGSQSARVVTEAWGAENFYCPNCSSPKLDWLKRNTKAKDYRCPSCGFWFQLKSQKSRIGSSITDGAYGAMMEAIQNDEAPSYYFMQYEIVPPRGLLPLGGKGGRRTVEGDVQSGIAPPPPDPLPAPDIRCRGRDGTVIAPLSKFGQSSHHSQADDNSPSPCGEGRDEGGQLWLVRNLLLVPHFAFPPSAIIKRKPLSPTARRAGWIGCNFALNRIPLEARIEVVKTIVGRAMLLRRPEIGAAEHRRPTAAVRDEGGHIQTIIVPPNKVRAQFKKIKLLKEIPVEKRGWTLDVLNIARRIVECGGKTPLSHDTTCRVEPRRGRVRALQNEFTNEDVYAFSRELEKLHPGNRHVKDKIRQQLQVLRDMGFLHHIGHGEWRLP
jgi:predicted RNA-binding Zn-ribbon protein involved in translation (DUF1610 family)